MNERKRGGQQGNQNATKEGRKRIKFDASLSGKRLTYFETQAAENLKREPTDQEIAEVSRRMFYEWVDSLLLE